MQELDKFYTKREVAALCWEQSVPLLQKITHKNVNNLFFIEPSAGQGDFYDLLPGKAHRKIGIDLASLRPDFIKTDFLNWDYKTQRLPRSSSRTTVVIGNPPFGHRGQVAVKFINKAATIADTIAFIVPVIFRKYFIHKLINEDLQWIYAEDLPRGAFYTDKKQTYEVNTEFQVWTRLKSSYKNKRLYEPPPIKHDDFIMHQYNNTKQALKVFNNDFDFAVPSQGWQDYTRRETKEAKCEKHKQWMLFKAPNQTIFERLYKGINYKTLAMKNVTSIPGFRKGDVVKEYTCKYG
ncbi:hypothetical protein COTS27_00199 [Spirochaetota bacterium]|nr:hypothetical protein COTS27_00199 [Spirochaetota bacterium]